MDINLIKTIFQSHIFELAGIIDFLFVYFLIYKLLVFIKNTQAEYLIRGIFLLFIMTFLSQFLQV